MPRGEIAHDGVGLVEDEAVVLDDGNQGVRVHREVLGRFRQAELAARIDALIGEADLVGAPHDLLHVDRREPPPDPKRHCRGGACPAGAEEGFADSITTGTSDECLRAENETTTPRTTTAPSAA